MEKICPFCGKKASGDLAFCPYCHKFYDGKERAKLAPKPDPKPEPEPETTNIYLNVNNTPDAPSLDVESAESGRNAGTSGENDYDNYGNYDSYDKNYEDNYAPNDGFNFWWCLLAFNIPFVGLILSIVWYRQYPKRSKYILIATLLGYAVVGFALFYLLLV